MSKFTPRDEQNTVIVEAHLVREGDQIVHPTGKVVTVTRRFPIGTSRVSTGIATLDADGITRNDTYRKSNPVHILATV